MYDCRGVNGPVRLSDWAGLVRRVASRISAVNAHNIVRLDGVEPHFLLAPLVYRSTFGRVA